MDYIVGWLSSLPHCALYGRPWLSALHLGASAGIFLAYTLIPIAIGIVLYRRKLPAYKFRLAWLFAGFIFFCGFGHLLDVFTTTTGSPVWYWVRTINDTFTAIVSLATAFYCFKLMPMLEQMPTIDQYGLAKETIAIYREAEKWRQHGKPWSD